ncbi:glycosyltransferase family 4 protein [Halogeometricum borinquense]|uniref:glycosyltransferase family 4 protein n=1 Tax=Halogeometricum borinquense TaxID=60847 RepID=UPI003447D719
MNIVHITAGLVPIHGEFGGGVERHIRAVTTGLAARDHNVTVVDRRYDVDDPLSIDGVDVLRLAAPRVQTGLLDGWLDHVLNECLYSAGLRRAQERIAEADVVHAHNMYAGLAARRLARKARVPFVYTCHNGMWCTDDVNTYEQQVVRRFEGSLMRDADASIAVSEAVADGARTYGDADPTVIPNGVDTEIYGLDADTRPVEDTYELDGRKTVLFVGRLARAKGVDVLVKAARDVLDSSNDPVRFVLVGPDKHMFGGSAAESYPTEIRRLLDKLGVRDDFVFAGQVSDEELVSLYTAADAFVLPSRYEAQGMVLLEALASGTPVVGTDVGGIPEVVTSDVGRVVPPEAPVQLAEALLAVLDADRNGAMSVAARDYAERTYAWPRIVSRIESVYEGVR